MKRFLIILVTLLWCSVGAADDYVLEGKIPVGSGKKLMCKITGSSKNHTGTILEGGPMFCHGLVEKHYIYFSKYKTEIITNGKDQAWFVYENVNKKMKCTNLLCKKGDGTLKKIAYSKDEALAIANPKYTEEEIKQIKIAVELKKEKEANRVEEEKQRAEAIASGDITFTINDKKEQCEAIGFTPQTDKFADCVLRLVELDVKSQQQKQIQLALSQGNQQVADELRKQRNQQGGQYLMDLGQKLLNPPTKKTTRCTVTGIGSFKTVTCR